MDSKYLFVSKGKGSGAKRFIAACSLFFLGSAYALAAVTPTEAGEIVMNHVGSLGKTFTMRGEVQGDKVEGFKFVVPGKKFDVKCTMYPYGYPKNPYNDIPGIEIGSAPANLSSQVGQIETYRFVLKCPMSGPFISEIQGIGKGGDR